MKTRLLLFLLSIFPLVAFSQAKKPTLMVIPSDAWCNANGFTQKMDNEGVEEIIPDYRKALSADQTLNAVISKINSLMADRGFPLKDIQQTVKSIANLSVEDRLISSRKSGASLSESPLDRFRRTAKADIFLELDWKVNVTGPKSSITYNLRGLDAYTNKQVAGSEGTGNPSFSAEIPVLLEEAVQDHMDEFCDRLMSHFEDMMENGREVTIDMRIFDDGSDISFEQEYDGVELTEIIDNWMAVNTVNHRFNKSDATEDMILYEQVRIPLYKANGMAQDADGFGRELSRFLRAAPYNLPTKIVNRGLGRCLIVIGEK